jgi:hypothetical protein
LSIDSLEDLIPKIASNEYYYVAPNLDGMFYDKINNSNEFPYEELRHAFTANPIRVVGSIEECLNHIIQKKSYNAF